MKSRPSPETSSRRRREASADEMACGSLWRRWRRRAKSSSRTACDTRDSAADTAGLLHQRLDLRREGHGGRALAPACDDRARDVGEADHAIQIPALEQPMAERPAESVAGAEPVDHVHDV